MEFSNRPSPKKQVNAALLKTAPANISATASFQQLRAQFPFYANCDKLTAKGATSPAYLDSAATSHRPQQVLDTEYNFAALHNAAVHRGTSFATGAATNTFEQARATVQDFLGAGSDYTLVWQAGATDALNTLAFALSDTNLLPQAAPPHSLFERFRLDSESEIVVTLAEHHANLVPWQRLAARTGAKLVVVPVTAAGIWQLNDFRERLNPRTRLVAFTHVSNVTGWIAPVVELVSLVRAHTKGALTVLDACQSAPHLPFNITDLGVDFAVFSGHKMLGPNGIGGLLGKTELLHALSPARTGGSSITTVTADYAEFLPAPHRFEPGTQPVSQAIALAAACDFLTQVGVSRAAAREHELTAYLVQELQGVSGLKLLGPQEAEQRAALAAVTLQGVHPHDVGQVLDMLQVVVRTGHHCAQPLHRALGINASVRASVSFTTLPAEIDRFVAGVKEAKRYFGEK